ncbi:MAG TPA: DUF4936 family protein [Caldimonas sp.]|nr:DUF4936 family protein [Caldimonas sp.]
MAARELFVWYRVRREHAREARAAVAALQRSLRDEWPGLQARLLVRDGDETSTWMETYALPTPSTADEGGIDEAIEAAITAAARPLERLIDGPRHTEAFAVVA